MVTSSTPAPISDSRYPENRNPDSDPNGDREHHSDTSSECFTLTKWYLAYLGIKETVNEIQDLTVSQFSFSGNHYSYI